MKNFSIAIAILLLLAPPAFAGKISKSRSMKSRPTFVKGEVLVKVSPRQSFAVSRARLQSSYAARAATALDDRGLTMVKLRAGLSVADAVKELKKDPYVVQVQPNYIYYPMLAPNDPSYASQWGAKNTGQTVATGTYTPTHGTAAKDMDLETAWATITDCSSVTVAVIDSGVNYLQEDLVGNLWNLDPAFPKFGYNFVDGNAETMDTFGHGTHVAGIIGATGNNSLGGTGVCWKSKIMALRVFDGAGNGATTSRIVQAINFAVAHGAKIINMSLGGQGTDATQEAAIVAAGAAGVMVIAAAGNDGSSNDITPVTPCNSSSTNVICVAALDQNYALATFSNFGATNVDVGAPGTNILSTWNANVSPVVISTGFTGFANSVGASWRVGNCDYTSLFPSVGITSSLMSPTGYCDAGTSAITDVASAASIDHTAFKNYTTITGVTTPVLEFYARKDFSGTTNAAYLGMAKSSSDPFVVGATYLDAYDGSSSGELDYYSYDLTSCMGTSCSIGFRINMSATVTAADKGLDVIGLRVLGYNTSTTTYNTIDGTSMATPYVTGLAAMIWAYNPNYTMADVIESVKSGGVAATSLATTTSTGKSVSASGSLKYIKAPTGITASVQ